MILIKGDTMKHVALTVLLVFAFSAICLLYSFARTSASGLRL